MKEVVIGKRLPIGISDYKKLISQNYYYIDKTLLIKHIWNSGEIVLIPRPRRFGKTINLSMARYFFERADTDFESLFGHSRLLQEYPEYRQFMGKYPVIFLTFKDAGEDTWRDTYQNFKEIIGTEFERHIEIYNKLTNERSKTKFEKIWQGEGSRTDFTSSLQLLSRLLYECYNQKVIIILDEYDAPLHKGYLQSYYTEVVSFMRSLMSKALKDNIYVERSFITGIFAVAKEGIFSGLNNLNIFPVTRERFGDSFGFTQNEVIELLGYYGMSDHLPLFKEWYDGYRFGDQREIYNPWSVLKCIDDNGRLATYWANTSNNALVKQLLPKMPESFKINFEHLLNGQVVEIALDESIAMPELDTKIRSVWSLLLFAGYLTYYDVTFKNDEHWYKLCLPNREIIVLFRNLVTDVLSQALRNYTLPSFISAIEKGDLKTLTNLMQEFVNGSINYFDIPQGETERSYHLFTLGLLVTLRDYYRVKSNRESGGGRYDIMLIPHEKDKTPVIIEFKKSDSKKELAKSAQEALKQIEEQSYAHDLWELGFKEYRSYGMAFYRKDLFIKMEHHMR